MAESGTDWIARFSTEIGAAPPSEEEIAKLLDLAAVAAHSSERIAAPIACWITGRAELDLDDAIALAKRLSEDLDA